jgi:hypothetical protein
MRSPEGKKGKNRSGLNDSESYARQDTRQRVVFGRLEIEDGIGARDGAWFGWWRLSKVLAILLLKAALDDKTILKVLVVNVFVSAGLAEQHVFVF